MRTVIGEGQGRIDDHRDWVAMRMWRRLADADRIHDADMAAMQTFAKLRPLTWMGQ